MRKRIFAAALALAAVAAPGVSAQPTGVASGNVEHLSTVPLETGFPTSARLVGKYLYVGGAKSFSIYDVSEPETPQLESITPVGIHFANEDVDTNGRILIMSDENVSKSLHVWDVRDKAKPVKLSTLGGAPDHTFTCVFDCKWAYGARGTIVDLRKPATPKIAGLWTAPQPGYAFDVTEVAPGRILTASRTMRYLDARKNPARPKEVALGPTEDNRLIHSNRWPRKAKDDFILVQGETPFTGLCNENSGAFMTWDATKWRRTHTFTMIDEFRVKNGTFTDGNPPAGATGCTNMWFQEHPAFRDGGLVASGFFEHGTRFLRVSRKGQISEDGYFMPAGGSTIAAVWITPRIVYAIDVTRGIDILKYTGRL